MGKCRSCSMRTISSPTAPVAPTTATLYVFFCEIVTAPIIKSIPPNRKASMKSSQDHKAGHHLETKKSNIQNCPEDRRWNFDILNFMTKHFLLFAAGQDHPGFVSSVAKTLFDGRCNLEDSSMMRLGAEFGMFVIFTSNRAITTKSFDHLKKNSGISIYLREISARQARFTPAKRETYIVRAHGQDQPGIVYHLTQCLAKHGFNITDLSTHRTVQGRAPGYIVLLEGELLQKNRLKSLQKDLQLLAHRLETRINIDSVSAQSL